VGAASVAQGTLLMIDETGLEPGQLLEQGVKNVQAVHALIGAKELVAGGGDGGVGSGLRGLWFVFALR